VIEQILGVEEMIWVVWAVSVGLPLEELTEEHVVELLIWEADFMVEWAVIHHAEEAVEEVDQAVQRMTPEWVWVWAVRVTDEEVEVEAGQLIRLLEWEWKTTQCLVWQVTDMPEEDLR
jgi:hypothetical protein